MIKYFLRNKKGSDKMLSVYWFLILFISAAAVVYMVFVFYSHPYDIRELEANILANKIADCVSQGGILNSDLLNNNFSEDFKTNFLEKCKINFQTEDTWKELQYYISINFYNINKNSVFEISEGNLNLISSCELQKDDKHEKLATCVERGFYSTGDNEQYLIKILSVVRKTEKNAKM